MKYAVNIPALRAEMAFQGRTISALAAKAGVSRATISGVLHGNVPSYATMDRIVNALPLNPNQAADIFFTGNLRKKKED